MPRGRGERKSIFDPVHGIVDLDGAALDLMAHRAFQRLWGIRQTGFAHLVFPGANHTRLEHSLGVFWVAGAMADALELSEERRRTVTAGALLHDLGHGPFSHTFDPTMLEVLGHGHEAISRAWITGRTPGAESPSRGSPSVAELLERHGLRPNAVADLVDPPRRPGRDRLLQSILHGAIDADRIDYLQRDAHYTGVAHGAIDAIRLLATVGAANGQLVFAEKGRSAVEGFLVGRALMYTSVYYHKTVRAAEVMAQAALERTAGYPDAARPLLQLTDGELLVRLRESGGVARDLVDRVTERRLFKQAFGWRELDASTRRALERLRADPVDRRAEEDAFAARLGGRPGSVLLDLSGLEARDGGSSSWSRVGIQDEGIVRYPFRPGGVWTPFTNRTPAPWSASVYVDPRLRRAATDHFARGRWLAP